MLRKRLPDEARLRIQHGHRNRRELALIAQQQRGFSDALAPDHRHVEGCVRLDPRNIRYIRFHRCFARDIAHLIVLISDDNLERCCLARLRHQNFRRFGAQLHHGVFRRITVGNPLRNPVEDRLVIVGILRKSLAAAVRDFLRRFCEHQALAGIGAVEAPARQVVEQRFVIELRIVSAQRKLEAVLSLRRTVTGAGRASGFVENRRDVP